MAALKVDYKTFTMRIPKDLMLFLKKMAAENETSMADILLIGLIKMKKKIEVKDEKST